VRRLILAVGLLVAGAAAVAACASAGAPPGGPDRKIPPEITSISVDSGQTNVKLKSVEFKFDEVVSDRPQGASTGLDQIFLISPRNGAADVSWHRTRVDVRPKNGFKPNTAYRITMLPGLVDLHGNVRKDTRSILFSTGETFPPYSIHGQVFDWAAQKIAPAAYIEAVSNADTNVVYVSASDTAGLFDVGPLPAGAYTVHALLDKNNNRTLDRGEQWDTTSVNITSASPVVELDVIERDSVPAVIDNIRAVDSTTLRVSFDKPLDPALPLQPALVRVTRPDSTALEVLSVGWAAAFDRAQQIADSARRADSTRARAAAGGARPAPAPVPAPPTPRGPGERPPPPPPKPRSAAPDRAVIVKLSPATPVLPGQHYYVEVSGFRNLVGHSQPSRHAFDVPKPQPKPAAADSARRVPRDTSGVRRR
jgi:hypothetical protein